MVPSISKLAQVARKNQTITFSETNLYPEHVKIAQSDCLEPSHCDRCYPLMDYSCPQWCQTSGNISPFRSHSQIQAFLPTLSHFEWCVSALFLIVGFSKTIRWNFSLFSVSAWNVISKSLQNFVNSWTLPIRPNRLWTQITHESLHVLTSSVIVL